MPSALERALPDTKQSYFGHFINQNLYYIHLYFMMSRYILFVANNILFAGWDMSWKTRLARASENRSRIDCCRLSFGEYAWPICAKLAG
jgi:hypothetical protein